MREILRLRCRVAQDFAWGLPLGFASLTPANRLKFKSARPTILFFTYKYTFCDKALLPTASTTINCPKMACQKPVSRLKSRESRVLA
jgi:hypothetical protein